MAPVTQEAACATSLRMMPHRHEAHAYIHACITVLPNSRRCPTRGTSFSATEHSDTENWLKAGMCKTKCLGRSIGPGQAAHPSNLSSKYTSAMTERRRGSKRRGHNAMRLYINHLLVWIPIQMTSAALPTAAAVGPKYSLQEGSHGTKLRIGDWTITTTKRPILNHSQIEAAERELSLPLPEMTFGHNSLVLEYKLSGSGSGSVPMSESSPVRISFEAMEALRRVATGEGWEERVGGGVLVSMAETWSRRYGCVWVELIDRSATSVLSDVPLSTKPVRPHDWTFSTTYPGHTGVHPVSSYTKRADRRHSTRRRHTRSQWLCWQDNTPSSIEYSSTTTCPCSRTSCTIMARVRLMCAFASCHIHSSFSPDCSCASIMFSSGYLMCGHITNSGATKLSGSVPATRQITTTLRV